MDKRLIVIPFNVPWNWSTDYLNQTAFELSKKGDVVICYLWGDTAYLKESIHVGSFPKLIRKQSKNIYLINPLYLIPFRRFKFITDLNNLFNIFFLRIFSEVISIYRGCRSKIFWIFDPNLHFIYKYFGSKYLLLYDCVDFFAIGDKDSVKATKKNEKLLCTTADLVVANSRVLQKHLNEYRKDVGLVPQGFRLDEFKTKRGKYIDLKLKSPVIGFVGGINDRLDLSILTPLIKNNPNWSFVLLGPVQMREKISEVYWNKLQTVLNFPNVKSGGAIDKKDIPGIVSQFDIGMIPYDISQDFNKYCYPMKVFEYFYLGKPVVSTAILELKRFPRFVKIGSNYREWEKIIKDILAMQWNRNLQKEERILAQDNSWKTKVGQICSFLPDKF